MRFTAILLGCFTLTTLLFAAMIPAQTFQPNLARTITVTHTALVAGTPTITGLLQARQNDGLWVPDTTFLPPSPVVPTWVETSPPIQPVTATTTWPTAAQPTASDPIVIPKDATYGKALTLAIICASIGLGIAGVCIFWCLKRRSNQKESKCASKGHQWDLEAGNSKGLPRYPSSVANPGAYPTDYQTRQNHGR